MHLSKTTALTSLMLATGCVSTSYRDTVAEFGTVTRTAVDQQSAGLRAIIDAEDKEIRNDLAEGRVDLVLPGGCITSVVAGTKANCDITRADGKELRTAPKFAHVLKLGNSLGNYSEAIGELARESGEDRKAFNEALVGAAGAASELDGALRAAAEMEGNTLPPDKLGIFAGIVGDVGGLLMERQRVRALKDLIIEADPVVQQTVDALEAAYAAERAYNISDRASQVQDLQTQLRRVNADPKSSLAQRLKAQQKFIEATQTFAALSNSTARFKPIGVAHAALRDAASRSATEEDLKAGIKAVLAVAQSVGEAAPKLIEKGEDGDDD